MSFNSNCNFSSIYKFMSVTNSRKNHLKNQFIRKKIQYTVVRTVVQGDEDHKLFDSQGGGGMN